MPSGCVSGHRWKVGEWMLVEGNAPALTFVMQLQSTVFEGAELSLLPELGFLPLVPELPGEERGLLFPAGRVSKLRQTATR
jgi:hypothetical protein